MLEILELENADETDMDRVPEQAVRNIGCL